MKDWIGNSKSTFVTNGDRHIAIEDREIHDYYATHPNAVEMLLQHETFNKNIWECACGQGHISEVLKRHGYNVKSSDLYDRGYPNTEIIDFLNFEGGVDADIVTNPPYKYATEFVEHALDISPNKTKIAMLLKLTFLETKRRYELFKKYPPKIVYVASTRLVCAKNGEFERYKNANAVAYGWYIWEKGFKNDPIIRWMWGKRCS